MAGERILVADDSVAVQEICRSILENEGYQVDVCSNGVAAMSYADLPDCDLIIIDKSLRDITGLDTAKLVKSDPDLYRIPILQLVHEDDVSDKSSQDMLGSNAWMVKPFHPDILLHKVEVLLEEREVLDRARAYMRRTADQIMHNLAEKHLQDAIDQKVALITERSIQTVVNAVDSKARSEVDARVTSLTQEKEAELVKLVVQEVAKNMVEKLAQSKVTEAMDVILREETEKCLRKAAENLLPGLVRDRIKEGLDHTLPKEVQKRVQKEAEDLVPDAANKVVGIIDEVAQRIVPKIAREILGEITSNAVQGVLDEKVPPYVQRYTAPEVDSQVRNRLNPIIEESAGRIAKRVTLITAGMLAINLLAIGYLVGDKILGGSAPWAATAENSDSSPTPSPTPKPTPTPAPLTGILNLLGNQNQTQNQNKGKN
jgi:DNA-binding response OmpR family regulator